MCSPDGQLLFGLWGSFLQNGRYVGSQGCQQLGEWLRGSQPSQLPSLLLKSSGSAALT